MNYQKPLILCHLKDGKTILKKDLMRIMINLQMEKIKILCLDNFFFIYTIYKSLELREMNMMD